MEKFLLTKIKSMQGSLIGIGIESEKIKKAIQNNNGIETCYLLEETSSNFNKKKLKLKEKGRTINIKKIRKTFKKKRIDNVICNYQTVKPFLKTFVRDSVYINKGYLFIYGTKEELEDLKNRYQRYTTNIQLTEEKDSAVLIIDNRNTKNNRLKDMGFWWKDTGTSIADFLTLILVN